MSEKEKDNSDGKLKIDDELLINEIQYNGVCIWDKSQEGHSNNAELSKAWDVVIKNIGFDQENKQTRTKIRGKWTYLKTRFSKELIRERQLKEKFTSGFEHYRRLQFLRKSLDPGESSGNFTEIVEAANRKEAAEKQELKEDEDYSEPEENDEPCEEEKNEEITGEDSVFPDSSKAKFNKMSDEQKKKASKTSGAATSNEALVETNFQLAFSSNDEVTLYLISLRESLKSLPLNLWSQLRTKIMELVEKYQEMAKSGVIVIKDEDDECFKRPSKASKRARDCCQSELMKKERDVEQTPASSEGSTKHQQHQSFPPSPNSGTWNLVYSQAPMQAELAVQYPDQVQFAQPAHLPPQYYSLYAQQPADSQLYQAPTQAGPPFQPLSTTTNRPATALLWDLPTNYQDAPQLLTPTRASSAAPQMASTSYQSAFQPLQARSGSVAPQYVGVPPQHPNRASSVAPQMASTSYQSAFQSLQARSGSAAPQYVGVPPQYPNRASSAAPQMESTSYQGAPQQLQARSGSVTPQYIGFPPQRPTRNNSTAPQLRSSSYQGAPQQLQARSGSATSQLPDVSPQHSTRVDSATPLFGSINFQAALNQPRVPSRSMTPQYPPPNLTRYGSTTPQSESTNHQAAPIQPRSQYAARVNTAAVQNDQEFRIQPLDQNNESMS